MSRIFPLRRRKENKGVEKCLRLCDIGKYFLESLKHILYMHCTFSHGKKDAYWIEKARTPSLLMQIHECFILTCILPILANCRLLFRCQNNKKFIKYCTVQWHRTWVWVKLQPAAWFQVRPMHSPTPWTSHPFSCSPLQIPGSVYIYRQLKGQCHKIFKISFFFTNHLSPDPWLSRERHFSFISIFSKLRKSIINSGCTAGVNNTSGKLTKCLSGRVFHNLFRRCWPAIYTNRWTLPT